MDRLRQNVETKKSWTSRRTEYGETRGRQTEGQTDIFFCVRGLDLETRKTDQSANRKPNASTNPSLRKPFIERRERLFI